MTSGRPTSATDLRERPAVRTALWALAFIGAAAVGFVSGRETLRPPAVEVAETGGLTVAVVEATIGRSIPYVVTGTWSTRPTGVSASEGVVTTIDVADGDQLSVGTVVCTVDLRPVVAAAGEVPSFRDLTAGASGRDVEQLQTLLRETGHLTARARGGVLDAATTAAVKRWQRSLGVAQDGTVRAADVVYLPSLPARIVLEREVEIGSRLADGQALVEVVPEVPELSITVPLEQAEQVQAGPLTVDVEGQQVDAVVVGSRSTETGDVVLLLAQPDGAPLCGERCVDVPLDRAAATYRAERVVVPRTTGAAVPTAAVRTAGDGATFVTTPDGGRQEVDVVAQGDGLTIVDGLHVGDVVRLVGEAP